MVNRLGDGDARRRGGLPDRIDRVVDLFRADDILSVCGAAVAVLALTTWLIPDGGNVMLFGPLATLSWWLVFGPVCGPMAGRLLGGVNGGDVKTAAYAGACLHCVGLVCSVTALGQGPGRAMGTGNPFTGIAAVALSFTACVPLAGARQRK